MHQVIRVLLATTLISFAVGAAAENLSAAPDNSIEKPAAATHKKGHGKVASNKTTSLPAFPYSYLGQTKMADGRIGIILGKSGKDGVRLIVEKGKNIDKLYRVLSVGETEFLVLYKPLHKRQTLTYQSILPVPAAPVPDAGKPAAEPDTPPQQAASVGELQPSPTSQESDTDSPASSQVAAPISVSIPDATTPTQQNTLKDGMIMKWPTKEPVDSEIAVTGPASTNIPSGREATMAIVPPSQPGSTSNGGDATMVVLPPSQTGSISSGAAPTSGSMMMGEVPKTGGMPMIPPAAPAK